MANDTNTTAPVSSTLYYRRAHPGGGVLGRCSYGVPGVPGIVVFDVALFLPGAPPATITLQGVALATPTPRNVGKVTSAVVAAGVQGVAVAQGAPIASPAGVAAVAAVAAGAAVEAASTPTSASVAAGKAAAAAVLAGSANRTRKGKAA